MSRADADVEAEVRAEALRLRAVFHNADGWDAFGDVTWEQLSAAEARGWVAVARAAGVQR